MFFGSRAVCRWGKGMKPMRWHDDENSGFSSYRPVGSVATCSAALRWLLLQRL